MAWTRERLKNLIATAYFDLFSIKGYKPDTEDIRMWLERYMAREKRKVKQKTEKK